MPAERRSFALAAAIAVVATALSTVPASADDAGPVGIGVARTADNRGTFTVTAWTDAPGAAVTSVSARVRAGDTVVAEVPALTRTGSTWGLPADAALKLVEDGGTMPHLGAYSIDVSATDDQGHTTTRSSAGTLDFTLRPSLIDTAGDNKLEFTRLPTYDRRSLGATDRLVGIEPGSGDQVPIEGRTVEVTRSYDGGAPRPDDTFTAVTDAEGRFTTEDLDMANWASFTARFTVADDQVHGDARAFGRPAISPSKASVTATADRTRVLPGQTVTVTGTVSTGSGADAAALADIPVRISLRTYGNDRAALTVTTDASGHFSAVLHPPAGVGVDGWSAVPADMYLSATAARGSLVVPDESVLRKVTASLAANGQVKVTGRLAHAYNDDASDGESVRLEYSADGRTGWQSLATGKSDYYGNFTLSAWGYIDGYYRVHHLGSDRLADSTSTPVRLSRVDTRVSSIKASATKVTKGATVTFTGTLQEYVSRTWRPYKGQHVELFFQKKGSTKWTYVASGTTSSTGKATLKGKSTADGKWLIQYFGDSRHFDSGGTAVYVDVR
ncbi:hypothetical protein [Streptomyces sp. NPDC059378]|uniref:hypothetical protein n=1 Tax=Streptomyces sp. NPDC059378 TaxID=3346815 RepID=UPI003677641B